MGSLIALLVALCAFTAFGQVHVEYEYEYEYVYDDATDSPAVVTETTSGYDWLFELLGTTDHCATQPCANGASCENTADGGFKCNCQEPFTGKTCQEVKDYCKQVTCGRGSCLFKASPPYYECKCNHPYTPPSCKRGTMCNPNPCQNGGTCIKGPSRRRSSFTCSCPSGYTGKFCNVGPNDCYEDNGDSYRGMVSVTQDGDECLDWNSYFILQKFGDPFTDYAGFDGLGPHNFCRNPDGDSQPWCFIKKALQLEWKYCDVRQCSTVTHPTAPTITPSAKPDVPAPTASFSQCGKPQLVSTSRIYGGKKSLPGAHPWQVSFQIRPTRFSATNFTHFCGGILLSSCWVLTAAHCITSDVEMQVVLGGVDIEKHEVYNQIVPVERAIVHENYRYTPLPVYNDIALLKLRVTDEPFCAKETRFVKSACLPDQLFQSGAECVVSGWGATETGYRSNYLLDARVHLISMEKCKAPHVYGDLLDDNMICAGYLAGGVDSCQGDSGGPLVCEPNGTHYVLGVVSWGDSCGKKYKPGVYANLAKFTSWISNHMNS
uniref:trypsin n=1 Tax=Neogobius melanostomus TaxID=47308 RepID=A0A8C6SIB9_9GOBI